MSWKFSFVGLAAFACLTLNGADPTWKTKPVAEWDENDAKQLLANSPWVKRATPALIPQSSEDSRREGGVMGNATPGPKALKNGGADLGAGQHGPKNGRLAPVTLRWESAFPVRTAEVKAHEMAAPDWDGDAYVIAVYDIPDLKTNDKILANLMLKTAVLKREGKKDLRPYSVQLMQQTNGLGIAVYLFPRSVEISKDDQRLEFIAQIGRLSLAQYFFPAEMELEGKLQL